MLMRLIRRYLAPYKWSIVLIVVLQLAQTIATLYLPSLNADIIDQGVAKGDTGYIWKTGALMLAVTLGQAVCSIIAVYFGAKSAMAFGRDVRAGVFSSVENFSEREVEKFGTASLITRNTNDVQQVQMLVFMSVVFLIQAPMMMVGGLIMALREDIELSWILAVLIPLLGGAVILIISRMVPLFKTMQTKIDRINGVLREQITGIRVIRAFVRRDYEADRFDEANLDLTKTSVSVGRVMAFMFPTVMFVMNLASVAVMWFGGHRVGDGSMEVGSLTAFLSYIMQILISVMMASMMFIFVPRASVCAGRIMEVLDVDPSIQDPKHPVTELRTRGTVEFRGATFAYPGAESPVLTDITFHANPGEITAIIGSTGSGKSTILNLIPRFYDVTGGQVLVGGVDVRELGLETLWGSIGLVPQKPYLFSGTVASNLRYGNPDATDEELWEALEVAQSTSFVSEMEGQLEAEIAQGGTNVSGGQRQRLAIARALVKKAPVYLFDDSFSALDFQTDTRLRAALKPTMKDSAMIVVAQRVTTIINADIILVIDDGQIVGRGTHDELMASCETYQEIVLSQLSAEEAA